MSSIPNYNGVRETKSSMWSLTNEVYSSVPHPRDQYNNILRGDDLFIDSWHIF